MARADEQLLVLYDRDCGFCAWGLAWLLRWDRGRRLAPLPIQSDGGARVLDAMLAEEQLASWHVADQHGLLFSGGAALPAVLQRLPGGGPLAALSRSCPRATERAYRWVADHRAGLGRLVPSASKDRARVLIAARMH